MPNANPAVYTGIIPKMVISLVSFEYFIKVGRSLVRSMTDLHRWWAGGGMGPLLKDPLDVVKTLIQKQVVHPRKELEYSGLIRSCLIVAREEGTRALWKGIMP